MDYLPNVVKGLNVYDRNQFFLACTIAIITVRIPITFWTYWGASMLRHCFRFHFMAVDLCR